MYNTVTLRQYAFKGYTVAIFGGGSSLTQEQIDLCRDAGCKAIAINNAYQIAPWADILYACDKQWWEWHNGAPDFKGWKITHEQLYRHETTLRGEPVVRGLPYDGIDVLISNGECGFEDEPHRIKHGGNSGFQALQIALKMGASKIILLGYDMHARGKYTHWHGEHPNGRNNDNKYIRWLECFEDLAALIDHSHIYNCTPNSDLNCFQKKDLKKVLTTIRG